MAWFCFEKISHFIAEERLTAGISPAYVPSTKRCVMRKNSRVVLGVIAVMSLGCQLAQADLAESPLSLQNASVKLTASVAVYSATSENATPHFHLVSELSKAETDCLTQQRNQLLDALTASKGKALKQLADMNIRNVDIELSDAADADGMKIDPSVFVNENGDATQTLEIAIQQCQPASSADIIAAAKLNAGKGPVGSSNPALISQLSELLGNFPNSLPQL
jgi:hypothetical protein